MPSARPAPVANPHAPRARNAFAKSTNSSEASKASARKLAVLIDLLYHKHLRFSEYERDHGMDYRSFQRDLQHLRKIMAKSGISITSIKDKERVELVESRGASPKLDRPTAAAALITQIGASLGAAVGRELGAEGDQTASGFIRFVMPRLIKRSQCGAVYDALKAAWEAKPGPAIVEFEYDAGKNARSKRRVEPYRVLLRSGRDYLLGYDLERKAWRTFALDAIATTLKRAGTIQKLREIPAQFDSNDVIGFFKSDREPIEVTVALTPVVAASMVSREWQALQRVEHAHDGSARITFTVTDVAEVVRWALGLGKEAWIVGPESARVLARRTVEEISKAYEARAGR